MRVVKLAILLLLILEAGLATSGESRPKVTGIYSSLAYNQEGGDLLGAEVFVVYSKHGYYVVFQSSEGEPSDPIMVKAQVDGATVSFSLPQSVVREVGRKGEGPSRHV